MTVFYAYTYKFGLVFKVKRTIGAIELNFWASADDSNDVSHLSISQFEYLLTLILTGGRK